MLYINIRTFSIIEHGGEELKDITEVPKEIDFHKEDLQEILDAIDIEAYVDKDEDGALMNLIDIIHIYVRACGLDSLK